MSTYNIYPTEVIPRDLIKIEEPTGNLYESISIISRRANQIAMHQKEELQGKLAEFVSTRDDNLEEVTENHEQIEISAQYERMPKPTLTATDEFLEGKVFFRNPNARSAR